MLKIKIMSIIVLLTFLINGCVSNFVPMKSERATIGPKTKITDELRSLPKPKEKIVAAVYKFRDQTGQYKASATGTSWSTAVTQGATSILLKALEESGWFIPIEREGLSNLLNERKIIRSSRASYGEGSNENQPLLPPLLFAGIVLEGGIISYETNLLTGGVGAKYFGAGASSEYRQDRVTVYLRASSTSNGRILKTVYTTKTILSQSVDVGVFRFVDVKRLLEVETGFTYNEPTELCVTEAIEKAVQSMIIEGVFAGLWTMRDSSQIDSDIIKRYIAEKEEQEDTDAFGKDVLVKPRPFGIGLNFGGQLYEGDYSDSRAKASWGFNITKSLNDYFYIGFDYSHGQLANENYFKNTTTNIELKGYYHLIPSAKVSPYLMIGGGTLIGKLDDKTKPKNNISSDKEYLSFSSGIGTEIFLTDFLAINLLLKNTYLFTDKIDGVSNGDLNDYFWGLQIGFSIYPNF